MSYQSVRRAVFLGLNPDARQTSRERLANTAIGLLILANVIAVILESVPSLESRYGSIFAGLETFSLVAFSVEYILRLWTSVEEHGFRHPIRGRLRFMTSPYAIIDL